VAKKARKSSPKRRLPKRSRQNGSPKPKRTPSAAAPPSKWTVMVYMAADVSADLDAHAVRDLREMEEATLDPAVRVVVQINRNWPAMPQRYAITDHDAEVVMANVPERIMGEQKTLSAFLKWVLDRDKQLDDGPTDRGYILVLWGHSYGLGFGRDHGDGLRLDELKGALETFNGRPGGRPLDILGANACAMAYVEAAYELRDHVDYIVASQIAVPFAGWPFETVLSGIKPGISAQEIGQLIVDRYVATFRAARKGEVVAMSLLNMAALRTPAPPDPAAFISMFKDLALAVMKVVDATDSDASDRLAHVRAAFLSAGVGEVRPLIDLLDLCKKLVDLADDLISLDAVAPGVDEMKVAAGRIVDFLKPKDEGKPHRVQGSTRFLVVNKQTGEPRDMNGLGVFAPFVTDPADLKRLEIGKEPLDPTSAEPGEPKADQRLRRLKTEQRSGRTTYQALDLMKGSQWAKLVYDALRAGLPSDVIDNVEASGATTRIERAEVTQMLVAVDSLFDVLDRRICAVRSSTLKSLPLSTGASGVAPKEPDAFLALQLLRHKDVREATQKPNGRGVSKTGPPGKVQGEAKKAISGFEALETTLGDLERAVRRTLTNGTFGLGPGPGGSVSLQPSSHGKGGGGHGGPPRDDKGGGGHGAPDLDDKGGGGHGPDPNGVVAGGALSDLAGTPTAAIAGLFADVGRALQTLEAAVGEAETLLAFAVTSGGDVVNGGPPNIMQVNRAFRIVDDASAEARQTLRRVLADPVYGFGPGPETVTVDDRRELARAGGLSSTKLKLM
jgi:hypothetical protein